ncbi:MAG TPA: hypothetical protein DCP90_01620 [Clostridiales bacterium]|nr:MAG: hypothetical protein A2Y22_01965 [Clostridiales bacterium GWD2_32_59]HAN09292.1 hypothetical protein [Clostridiales bacterium]
MNDVVFLATINSEIKNIDPVVKENLSLLPNFIPNISKEDILDLRLILSEAISNAMIHGNNKDIAKSVFIKTEVVNKNTILFKVENEGSGFNYKNIVQNVRFLDLYKEDGRGFLLINSLSDNVEFLQNGREINIYKTVGPPNV